MITEGFNFEVTNGDVSIRFSCNNYRHRIEETIANLSIGEDKENSPLLQARFISPQKNVRFVINGEDIGNNVDRPAVFFENTDYPVLIKGMKETVVLEELRIAGHKDETLSLDDNLLYGMLNFRNQVGQTDFAVVYTLGNRRSVMSFSTEVLSYKMDYRTDMKRVIVDIEAEYSMLSYSFLKQTYLSFHTRTGRSTDLIWWQIFQSCYNDIVESARLIINSPKLRLHSTTRYERAERLTIISPELENEYEEFKNEPNHLYHTEEMFLSKDTVENRFLKHVLNEVLRRFNVVREHIKKSLNVNDSKIGFELESMSDTLLRLIKHPFFKSIGRFRGFNQDSLVMKKSRGYSTVYKSWVLLSCGYELEEGMHRLEVKEISDLYEIWCYIRVKNMVQDILKGKAIATTSGKELTTGFIRQLVYGTQSEVKFIQGDTELASVMYNAQTEEAIDDESAPESAIKDTCSFTTAQRPDIVLRLSKKNDSIQYTYLFDAKYRIQDRRKNGVEVPPPDAIDQMHRYRDAIYYTESIDDKLKKEVIGGFVLYPGNLNKAQYVNSFYHNSIQQVGIGAFPLKPGHEIIAEDGSLLLDPLSSESVLYEQLKVWLNDEQSHMHLLESSIPQKGLHYQSKELRYLDDVIMIGYLKNPSLFRDWTKRGYYAIRRKSGGSTRSGEVTPDRMVMTVQHILLYFKEGGELKFEALYAIKDPQSVPEYLNGEELVDGYGYPDKTKSRKDNYLLYSISPDSPSSLNISDSQIRDYIAGIFHEDRKENRAPVFMTVRELLAAINNN